MKYTLATFLASFLLILTSCVDDSLYDEIGKGQANISAEITFSPLVPTLESRAVSGGTPGNAIKDMKDVCIVIYKENGDFYKKYYFDNVVNENTTASPSDRPSGADTGGDTEFKAESATRKTTLKLDPLPYGRYYIYAAANVGDLTDSQVATADDFKNIVLTWNADNIASNNQMFGYFSTDNTSDGFEAKPIAINQPDMSLHAWVKRAASKVTIAFDARNLNENIYIYLKTAEIKDIPAHCYLGADNKPGTYSGDDAEMNELIETGQTIKYVEDPTKTNYNESWEARISRGRPIYGFNTEALKSGTYAEQLAAQHGENVNALYFYENMQGEGESGKASDKWQVVDGATDKTKPSYPEGNTKPDGTPEKDPSVTGWKDNKKYGSYIEVKAYYVSNNAGDVTRGDIIYRFMLGKDTHLNFDAARNYHYKLTMCFRGYANDVDWHIEYPRKPGMEGADPYYISYLYNHAMSYPLQVNTESDVEVTGLKAEIISNNWAPANPGDLIYWKTMNQTGFSEKYQYNGFLSLHKVTATVYSKNGPWDIDANESHYNDTKCGLRTYFTGTITSGEHTTDGAREDDKFTATVVKSTLGNSYHFQIPMYTREKNLIKQTAYTGNNLYEGSEREAKVRFTATLSKGEPYVKEYTIKQVKRLVNPKGIYRTANNQKSFNVEVKERASENSTTFTNIISDGPWRAFVYRSTNNIFDLSSVGQAATTKNETITVDGESMTVKTINGETGSEVVFNVDFKTGQGDAIVRVEYNNYSSVHLIFVKKGDQSVALIPGGTKWKIANMKSQSEMASSPCDEGSLFKWDNWNGIDALKNKNSKSPWVKITPEDLKGNAAGQPGQITVGYWDSITAGANDATGRNFTQTSLSNARIATYDDYKALYDSKDIEQGYGVLYGDESSSVATDIETAFEYDYKNTSDRGMRGCFVYNKTTGANIFFPIGASGYGHRNNSIKQPTSVTVNYNIGPNIKGNPVTPNSSNNTGTARKGLLRYSSNPRWGYFNVASTGSGNYPWGVNCSPLFFDIYMRPGAIYWIRQTKQGNEDFNDNDMKVVVGWDINYFSLDFYPINAGSTGSGADACFIRCVDN